MELPDGGDVGQAIEDKLGQVISAAFADGRMMAVRWVCLVEAIETGPGDESTMWSFTSANARAWETKGLLRHAIDIEQARTFGDVNGLGDGDGDG